MDLHVHAHNVQKHNCMLSALSGIWKWMLSFIVLDDVVFIASTLMPRLKGASRAKIVATAVDPEFIITRSDLSCLEFLVRYSQIAVNQNTSVDRPTSVWFSDSPWGLKQHAQCFVSFIRESHGLYSLEAPWGGCLRGFTVSSHTQRDVIAHTPQQSLIRVCWFTLWLAVTMRFLLWSTRVLCVYT